MSQTVSVSIAILDKVSACLNELHLEKTASSLNYGVSENCSEQRDLLALINELTLLRESGKWHENKPEIKWHMEDNSPLILQEDHEAIVGNLLHILKSCYPVIQHQANQNRISLRKDDSKEKAEELLAGMAEVLDTHQIKV